MSLEAARFSSVGSRAAGKGMGQGNHSGSCFLGDELVDSARMRAECGVSSWQLPPMIMPPAGPPFRRGCRTQPARPSPLGK